MVEQRGTYAIARSISAGIKRLSVGESWVTKDGDGGN